jgi:hypothetical protein
MIQCKHRPHESVGRKELVQCVEAVKTGIAWGRPDDVVRRGRATVDRMLPWARDRLCPHRETLLGMAQAPEAAVVKAVVGYLGYGPKGALITAVATYLVQRGIPLLCDARPSTAYA